MKNKRYMNFCKKILYRTKFQMSSFSSIARILDHNSLPPFFFAELVSLFLTHYLAPTRRSTTTVMTLLRSGG